MKVEPTASTTFTTEFEHVDALPALAPADSYVRRRHDYDMMITSEPERILPPSEPPDCRLSAAASRWSPPYSVCHDQLTSCRQFHEVTERGVRDSYSEALQHHDQMSDYKGMMLPKELWVEAPSFYQ